MQMQYVEIGLRWLPGIAAALVFGLFVGLGRMGSGKRVLKTCAEWGGYLAVRQRESSWYERQARWLVKKGADYHLGHWIQPTAWLAIKMWLGLTGFVTGIFLDPRVCLPLTIAFAMLPTGMIAYLNSRDNEDMLSEIKLIYHALEIQIRAGIYVTDALTECYAGVQNKRLRQALLGLAGDITVKADIYDAMDRFQKRFDNRYIDSLCITVLQALESGQAVELLQDIAEQVKDVETAVLGRRKGSLDRSITFYQLGILSALLAVILYGCVTQMFSSALSF